LVRGWRHPITSSGLATVDLSGISWLAEC
jgi:hypothetical protein